jgi:hypothetical protein
MIPLSRTSSRSTVTLATDAEAPTVGQRTKKTREQSIESAGSNPGPGRQKHKRARDPKSEGSDDSDDGEYLPRKRARLSRSSTRTIRAVRKLLSIHNVATSNNSLCRRIQRHPLSLGPRARLRSLINHPLVSPQSSPVSPRSNLAGLVPSHPAPDPPTIEVWGNQVLDKPPSLGEPQGRPQQNHHFSERHLS